MRISDEYILIKSTSILPLLSNSAHATFSSHFHDSVLPTVSPLSIASVCMGAGHHGSMGSSCPSPSSPQLPITPEQGVEIYELTCHTCFSFMCLDIVQVLHVVLTSVISCVYQPCHVSKYHFLSDVNYILFLSPLFGWA